MFRLQRLEITGFKSFADYTEVLFTGNGITAVVGPNGCGKSNISDAISWVLGEQRAKALRGDEMKDLIFQGTAKRQPSGMAEVVLHLVRTDDTYEDTDLEEIDETLNEYDENAIHLEDFDPSAETAEPGDPIAQTIETAVNGHSQQNGNSVSSAAGAAPAIAPAIGTDLENAPEAAEASVGTATVAKRYTKRHWQPRRVGLDFAPGESVSVTRRLYMSGESEYLLNNKACRLRDINDLFSGTGLSGAHYAIVEQGRIGQILSAKPADRRALIEEAAGIAKFRTRQRAAEVRLETARTNLRRISDIVDEIERQANSLRRQAAKTRRYKIMQEEFRGLLGQVFAAEGERFGKQLEELHGRLATARENETSLTAQVTALEESFRQGTQTARAVEEELSQLRGRHADSALQRDRDARELAFQEKQIEGLNERLKALQEDTEVSQTRINEITAEVKRLRDEEGAHRTESDREAEDLLTAEDRYQTKLTRLRETEDQQETKRVELFQHTTAIERFAEITRQLEDTQQKLHERGNGLTVEGERAAAAYKEVLVRASALNENIGDSRRELSGIQERGRLEAEALEQTRTDLQSLEKNFHALQQKHSRSQHRLESLQEMEARHAIYEPPVQKLLGAEGQIGVRFAGTLADKFHVDARAERAVENLFGPLLQTVLVESEADALKVAKWLGVNHIGRVTTLSLSGSGTSPTGNIAEYLGVSREFARILTSVFPREMSAWVTGNIDAVDLNRSGVWVTLEGDVITGGKLFTAGKAPNDGEDASLLAFKREIRELGAALVEMVLEVSTTENTVGETRSALQAKEENAATLKTEIAAHERELFAQEIEAKNLQQEVERAERHSKVVAEEIEQTALESQSIKERLQKTEFDARTAGSSRGLASDALAQITANLNDIRNEVERESADLSEKRATAAAAAERGRALVSSLRRIEVEQIELESRIARQTFETRETEGKIEETNTAITALGEKIARAEEEQAHEHEELVAASEKLKTARASADEMSEQLTGLNHDAAAARNSRGELEITQAEVATRLENLRETCQQELTQTLEQLSATIEYAEDFEYETGRARLDELRQRLENYGAVNLLALEELGEVEERFLFLTSQRQDIIDSIGSAEEALREIKTRSRERFRDAFEKINANFSEFFVELFGGGKGEMTLLEADDILDAGIEVVAQPPGKRLQSVMLLSGGEKALSAIALVMGIFKYRPSPFCLLDEVDAPLDEANIGRFVNKIDEMSEKTQFIVVTHSKRTMESAKALYGVTMEEAGVSKLVSVRFE